MKTFKIQIWIKFDHLGQEISCCDKMLKYNFSFKTFE